ncbi:MAG: Crp/Fnr family transcriptional regulator [Flavobacteriaceae bacterium]|nr:Crp/Fnr family transcriptional regulator [Flavobacteriaceae bacterium]
MPKGNHSKRISNNLEQRRNLLRTFKLIAKHEDTANLISIKAFNKGDYLVEESKSVHGVFFILEGKVKVFSTGLNQKSNILRFVSKGDMVGLSSLNSSYYWASAIVMEQAKVYFIDLEHLHFILNNNRELSILLINKLSDKLSHYKIRQKHLTLFSASERVIDALLLIAYKFGETTNRGIEISVGTARKDIANFANTSVEFAIRALSDLNSKNYITLDGKMIIINEKEILLDQLKQVCNKSNLPNDLGYSYPDFFY